MNDITLKINGLDADLGETSITLNYNIFSFDRPDLRGLPSTFNIKIPKTNTNLRLIKEGGINTAAISVEFMVVISGNLVINGGDGDYFDCTITSSDSDFIKEFGKKSLRDLKHFKHIDQIFRQHIKSSLRDTHYTPFALKYMMGRLFTTDITGEAQMVNIDYLQHLNSKYRPYLKNKPLTFPIQAFGNFYRLPNKEIRLMQRDGDLKPKSPIYNQWGGYTNDDLAEVRPYQGAENINPNDITGYVPPSGIWLRNKKVSENTLVPTKPFNLDNYVDYSDNKLNAGGFTVSSIVTNPTAYEYFEENELYEIALFYKDGGLRSLYLGDEFIGDKRAWFTVLTDRLKRAEIFDSLAYNDIPPVFNFYTILCEMFNQYGIVLKVSDDIYNKLSNEYLTYSGDGFQYNYKNNLGIADITNNLAHKSDDMWSFDCRRAGLFIPNNYYNVENSVNITGNELAATSVQLINAAGVNSGYAVKTPVYQQGTTTIGSNVYQNGNFIGIWDNNRPEFAGGRLKYDIYSSDGAFKVNRADSFSREFDKEVLYYTMPFRYRSELTKKLEELYEEPEATYPITETALLRALAKDREPNVLDSSILSNKFIIENSTLDLNTYDTSNGESNYTGALRYGYGYRCPKAGNVTFRVDFDYETPKYSISEWGEVSRGGISGITFRPYGKKKPVYLVLAKTKKFENYKSIDDNLSTTGRYEDQGASPVIEGDEPFVFGKSVIKYWDLVEWDGGSYRLTKKVLDTISIEVDKDDVLNLYVVFQGYSYATPYNEEIDKNTLFHFDPTVPPTDPKYIQFDYSAEMYVTKCDVDIIFNDDYYIDVAKNLPDINQLKFFKDILVENRLLPYYDNISKTITLKSFNDVAKNGLTLDKFSIEDSEYESQFNQNVFIQYKAEESNINANNFYGFKYEEKDNTRAYVYEFDYSQSENSKFDTYVSFSDIQTESNIYFSTMRLNSYIYNTGLIANYNIRNFMFAEKNSPLTYDLQAPNNASNSTNMRIGTVGNLPDFTKQFSTIKITNADNNKKIAEDVDWSFGYNTTKVRVDKMVGIDHKKKGYNILDYNRYVEHSFRYLTPDESYVYYNVNPLDGIEINSLNPNYGKADYDSFYITHFDEVSNILPNAIADIQKYGFYWNDGVAYRDRAFIEPIFNNDIYNSLILTAQRGQYRFRNGLLTNELFRSLSMPLIRYEEIQSIASKDYNFLDAFYREYGLNFEKEIVDNPIITCKGILPITDYYKVTNEGVCKVWIDNSWYYLLSVDRYNIETEQATIKILRKKYGD